MPWKIEEDHFTEYVSFEGDRMVCDRLQFEVRFTECEEEGIPFVRSKEDGTFEKQGPIRCLKREK
jgi:hypothetical protein